MAYLVNPNKIDAIINDSSSNTLITTKRYLRHISDNQDYNDTLLVIAYKRYNDFTDDYEYVSVELNKDSKTLNEGTDPVTSTTNICDKRKTYTGTKMVDYLNNLVKGYNKNDTSMISLSPPGDNSCTNTFRFDNAKTYEGRLDNNLKYVGLNPCNYVSFNDELWRIIGVMNNIDDGSGKLESRVKLIRAEPLGEYSWDTTPGIMYDTSDSNINDGMGINDWTQADLMIELNSDYLNYKTGTTKWYNGSNNKKEGTYDFSKGIKEEPKCLIDIVR